MNTKRSLTRGAMLAVLASTPLAHASIHYAILPAPSSKGDVAYLDVGADSAPQFQYWVKGCVPPAGVTSCIGFVTIDDTMIGSSPDLYSLTTATGPTLVMTMLTDSASNAVPLPSMAMLRVNKQVLGVAPIEKAQGTQFNFPVAVESGAVLLIANPGTNANDCSVTISNSPLARPQTVFIPLDRAVEVPLTQAGRVTISSPTGVAVIVELMVTGKGKDRSLTMIPPAD